MRAPTPVINGGIDNSALMPAERRTAGGGGSRRRGRGDGASGRSALGADGGRRAGGRAAAGDELGWYGGAQSGAVALSLVKLRDAELAELAGTDPEAFGVLYDRYADAIHRWVRRELSAGGWVDGVSMDDVTAESVTAEVFFTALRGLEGFTRSQLSFSAWLSRIAATTVADYLSAADLPASDSVREGRAAPSPTELAEPAGHGVSREEADRVWRLVDGLSEAQRTAVILRLAYDLSVSDIATRMGRSQGAVTLLLRRGLANVKTRLAG